MEKNQTKLDIAIIVRILIINFWAILLMNPIITVNVNINTLAN